MRATRFRVDGEEYVVVSYVPLSGEAAPDLTPTEREVVALVLEGLSNKEIAQIRGTSTRTVANQIASVFRKLGVSSRGELVSKLSTGGPQGET